MLARTLDHEAPDDVMGHHCLHMLHPNHLHQRLIVQVTHFRYNVPLKSQAVSLSAGNLALYKTVAIATITVALPSSPAAVNVHADLVDDTLLSL